MIETFKSLTGKYEALVSPTLNTAIALALLNVMSCGFKKIDLIRMMIVC